VSAATLPRVAPARRGILWLLETPVGLFAMFAVAFAIRVAIAPHIGFVADLSYFKSWSSELARIGPRHFYAADRVADYPPGYLYLLWLVGKVTATPGYLAVKLPPILADLGIAWVAGTFAARLAPRATTERYPVRALAAAAVLFNPAVIALSAVWGQVDSVPAFFVLASLLLLYTRTPTLHRELGAFLLFGVAFSMKPQAGFALPVMVYALYRRHVHRRSGRGLAEGLLTIGALGIASLAVVVVTGLGFDLGPTALYRFIQRSASEHPVTSANAFNLWGLIGSWRNDSTGTHVMSLAGVHVLWLGTLLFLAAAAVVLWRVHGELEHGAIESRLLLLGSALTSLLGYALLTRMHERYVFTSLVLFAPLVFARPFRWVYGLLSAALLLNLWFAFSYYNRDIPGQSLRWEPVYGWLYGGFAFDTWQKKLISGLFTAGALLVAWQGFAWLRRVPVPPVETAAEGDEAAGAAWPVWLAGLAVVFGLVVLRGETRVAENLNDSSFHLLMVRWAEGQIHQGRLPLDGWFPYLSLGSSFFHHYQSLPQTLTALGAVATGAGAQTVYLWTMYVLLATWPLSVYMGARLLGWDRWTAGAAAAVSPLVVSTPGYGFEHGSYVWQGYGVYSQLWAMWLMPLAWGLSWRAVREGRRYALAALAVALTIACHFIAGYLVLLTIGVWVIVLGRGFWRHAGRGALVGVGALAIASWTLVPLIQDTKWSNQSEYYKGTIFNDSYGARTVLHWLFHGQLFDAGRFPVLSLLVLGGVVACAVQARRDPRARALLGVFALSLALFFGRPTWGRALDLLPGMADIQVHRFVMGVDMAGILLAGVGLAVGLRWAQRALRGLSPSGAAACAVGLGVLVLAPAWVERLHYDNRGAADIRVQRSYDATTGHQIDRLLAIVKKQGGGRVYAGDRANWGADYRIGYVPMHAWLADHGIEAIGFTFRTVQSLSTDPEAAFDETNPAQYQMFDVRWLLLPADRPPPVPATLVASGGGSRLYRVDTSGYFQVVDRAAAIRENRSDVANASAAFRSTNLASRSIYPGVAFAGGAAPPPTFKGPSPPSGPAGVVISQHAALADGTFDATVDAGRTAVVLLKATYDPRWSVTVDGVPAKAVMMAPSLVGVQVGPGTHTVAFHYEPYADYPLLFGAGLLALVFLVAAGARGFLGTTTARGGSAGTASKPSSSPTT
jgi:Gpi18-like mannosyltransferase